ncbi:uncharacterized [Tachysurus ichikawai]
MRLCAYFVFARNTLALEELTVLNLHLGAGGLTLGLGLCCQSQHFRTAGRNGTDPQKHKERKKLDHLTAMVTSAGRFRVAQRRHGGVRKPLCSRGKSGEEQ